MMFIKNLESITFKELREKYPVVFYTINKYYPIGVHFKSKLYKDFSGIKLVHELVEENLLNYGNLKLHWMDGFCKYLKKEIDLPIIGATFKMAPAYAVRIIIEESDDLKKSVELHCKVSLLDNFFSIQIGYFNRYKRVKREESYLEDFVTQGIKKLVVSPEAGHYGDLFLKAENCVRSYFKHSVFLSTHIDFLRLKGLTVTYNEMEDMPIGNAFFHNTMPIDYYKPDEIVGDLFYNIDESINFKE